MFVPFTVANFKNNEKIKATAHNTLTNRLAGTTTSTITVWQGQNLGTKYRYSAHLQRLTKLLISTHVK